ncbi:MAG TPA: DUF1697 domain-containing protein [Symbiobacteriaceae bacterium]|nr:DUF1697 domain-containing protein [Symbiobacteriaceae bacterium]
MYVALLRGINVSGQKLIKMAELKRMFEDMGFTRVQTYIQSGNVIFAAAPAEDPGALRRRIEERIEAVFGWAVPVVLRTPAEFAQIIESSPYRAEELPPGESLYVALLAEAPAQEGIDRLMAWPCNGDEFRLMGREIYIIYRQGAGRSKLTTNLFEQKLKVAATARNWQTISKLAALATVAQTHHDPPGERFSGLLNPGFQQQKGDRD